MRGIGSWDGDVGFALWMPLMAMYVSTYGFCVGNRYLGMVYVGGVLVDRKLTTARMYVHTRLSGLRHALLLSRRGK